MQLWIRTPEMQGHVGDRQGILGVDEIRSRRESPGRVMAACQFVQELPARVACALAAASNAAMKTAVCDRLPSPCRQCTRLVTGSRASQRETGALDA
jgi:hypothetical protein